jgi:hypothetical protein
MFQVGPASDVYGFGVTLIQLLMGLQCSLNVP